VQGNGQTELTEAIFGLQDRLAGEVTLDGAPLHGKSVAQVVQMGVGFVPEDRQHDGLVPEFTIAENLILNRSRKSPFVRFGSLRLADIRAFAQGKLTEFDVRAQDIHTAVGRLSGGNQQKVVLARELARDLRLFIASQPTRGLDVGSIEFVHKQIIAARDSGIPVIVVSTELDEVSALADRIAVVYRGRIVGIVPADTPRQTLGLMMAGERPAEAAA
jgi:simple sugar transport system ATP-binding protein